MTPPEGRHASAAGDTESRPAAGAGAVEDGAGRAGIYRSGREWARELREAAPDEQSRTLVTQLAVEPLRTPGADGEPDARYVSSVLARVEELAVSRLISGVKSRLQRMDPVAAQADYNRLFGDLIGLEQRRKVDWNGRRERCRPVGTGRPAGAYLARGPGRY